MAVYFAAVVTLAPLSAKVSWPPGPAVACVWNASTASMQLSWNQSVGVEPDPYPADVYEIQVAESRLAPSAAVVTTSGLSTVLGIDLVLPTTTYYISARAHAGWAFPSGRFLNAGTWGTSGSCGLVMIPWWVNGCQPVDGEPLHVQLTSSPHGTCHMQAILVPSLNAKCLWSRPDGMNTTRSIGCLPSAPSTVV